ncbi:glycosyltransferase family 87 protein [Sphingomonas sp. URHD0057]|uniref:glycosyltransferase family 87 protein n=1 Tax=Sphingomonas sp. URHD0057 TaxID=1380389 RepID=UPI000687060D|nr:glycosyltransferase family 87 protein [Sphingomonas sp. URHD0057]
MLLLAAYYVVSTWRTFYHPITTDFASFWAAGRLTLQGAPWDAYNIPVHKALELTTGALKSGVNPFPYPPPFLFFVAPFGAVPYWIGIFPWVGITGALYVWACRRAAPMPYALIHPAALVNALIGQNGFLTSAIFIGGTSLLSTRPWLAGAILGVLVIKPQLALLLPVALIAAREWKAIAGGVATSSILLLLALIAFGITTYQAFLAILPHYTAFVQQGMLPWNELASVFALCRFMGLPETPSLIVHAMVAAAAALATWHAWSRDHPAKVPVLCAATLLIPPYIYTHDTLLMVVPMAYFIQRNPRPALVFILWLFCALPFASYADLYPGPNTIPIAAILSMGFLLSSPEPAASAAHRGTGGASRPRAGRGRRSA